MSRLKIGLVGVYRPLFKGDSLGIFTASAKALERLARSLDFELHAAGKPASNLQEAETVAREIHAAGVDLLLLQASSFCGGDALTPFAQGSTPLGLWAVPEPTSKGRLLLNSLCAINLYASVLGRKHPDRSFKWFYGLPEDEMFALRFRVTVRALKAKKALASARIGLIGGHAPGFDNLAVDKERMTAVLGAQVLEHPLSELLHSAKEVPEAEAVRQAAEMRRRAAVCTAPEAHVAKAARFEVALKGLAARRGYDALAVRCWPEVPEQAGIMICAAMGGVCDLVPTACEGDVLGAASMIALKTMTGSPPMLVDLSHVDEADQTVQMWHCGNSPASWADESGTRLECHFNRDTMGAVRSMVFRPGPATVFQLSSDGAVGLSFAGRFLGGAKPGFHGSCGWLGDLQMNGAPLPVRDLLSTVFAHRLPHHFPIGAGDVSEEVAELCTWLGVRMARVVPYRDGLTEP